MLTKSSSKALPIEEIESKYPSQWILIDQPEFDSNNHLAKGVVVFAHADKRKVHRKIGELKLARIALHSTYQDSPDELYAL